jgi:hypothetical protein
MALSTIQTIGILVGIFYYITTIRTNQRNQELQLETRQTQLFMQIYQEMSTPETIANWAEILGYEWDNYEDFEHKYGSGLYPDLFGKRVSIWRIFDGIGLLLYYKLIDIEKVYELIDSGVLIQWKKWAPIIKEQRIRHGFPEQNKWFEYLNDELTKIRNQRGIESKLSETFARYIPDL